MKVLRLQWISSTRFRKMFVVSTGGINELVFCTSGECIYIPESSKSISVKSPSHVRVEIRKNSLHVYVNEEQLYNYNDLPEDVTGTIGFLQGKGYQGIDNFRIYKLP